MFSGPWICTNFLDRSSPALVTTTWKSPFFTRAMTAESSVLPAGAKYQAETPAAAARMASTATQRLRGIRIMGGSTARINLSAPELPRADSDDHWSRSMTQAPAWDKANDSDAERASPRCR